MTGKTLSRTRADLVFIIVVPSSLLSPLPLTLCRCPPAAFQLPCAQHRTQTPRRRWLSGVPVCLRCFGHTEGE